MRVHLGSDHAGLELKEHLLNWLADHGYEAVDHGPFVYDALDGVLEIVHRHIKGGQLGDDLAIVLLENTAGLSHGMPPR